MFHKRKLVVCSCFHSPVNFLAPSHRIVYSLASGALAATFVNLVLNEVLLNNSPLSLGYHNHYAKKILDCE